MSSVSSALLLFICLQLLGLREIVCDWRSVLSEPYRYILKNIDSHKLDIGAKLLGKAVTKFATYDLNQTTNEPYGVPDWSAEVVHKREKYLRIMSKLDKDECLSLMICQCCADPAFYGDFGVRVHAFFRFLEPHSYNIYTNKYKEVAIQGYQTNSALLCKNSFSLCKANIRRLTIVGRKKLGF